jgi:hypothetical protein
MSFLIEQDVCAMAVRHLADSGQDVLPAVQVIFRKLPMRKIEDSTGAIRPSRHMRGIKALHSIT